MPIIEPFLLIWAGILCAVTALIHSFAGDRDHIASLIAEKGSVIQQGDNAAILRFAWHWTTALWLIVAAVLVLAGLEGVNNRYLIAAIGGAHLAAGVYDAIVTRGRHMAWPLFVLTGALVLISLYLTR